jgi:hypothetical protein
LTEFDASSMAVWEQKPEGGARWETTVALATVDALDPLVAWAFIKWSFVSDKLISFKPVPTAPGSLKLKHASSWISKGDVFDVQLVHIGSTAPNTHVTVAQRGLV